MDAENNEDEHRHRNNNEDGQLKIEVFNNREANNVNMCNKMDNLVYDARLHGYQQNKHEQNTLFCHRIYKDAIREENKKLLQGKGGLNESLDTKMEQLQLHERIHRLTEGGALSTIICRITWMRRRIINRD